MAITNGYGNLTDFKSRHDIKDTLDDSSIESYITAVSRAIDDICWERFYTTTADETRYFTAERANYLKLEFPIVSITSLKTDNNNDRTYEYTWSATADYDLMPLNAALDGKPYRYILTSPIGNYNFPTQTKGVEIIGKFGWSTTPRGVVEACYLGANRLMQRQTTPLGISAAAALGQLQVVVTQLKSDTDFMMLLAPFRSVS